jgi:hypothetical protein
VSVLSKFSLKSMADVIQILPAIEYGDPHAGMDVFGKVLLEGVQDVLPKALIDAACFTVDDACPRWYCD